MSSYEDAESSLELSASNNSFGKDILEAAEKVHSSYRSNKDSLVCFLYLLFIFLMFFFLLITHVSCDVAG